MVTPSKRSPSHSPHFSSGGAGLYPHPLFTNLNLVNAGSSPARVTVKLLDEDGMPLAVDGVHSSFSRELLPCASMQGEANELFGYPPSWLDTVARVGSVAIEATNGLVGDVLFGNADGLSIATAVLVAKALVSEAFFAHVAEGASGDPPIRYFTGISAQNPSQGNLKS